MSFLSGSPWQQPGVISGGSGYGQPSSGHQQQQHKPPNALSAANIPAALASSSPSPSGASSVQLGDWHCQGQMAPGGQLPADDTPVGSKTTSAEDEATSGRSRTEGRSPDAQSANAPALKIEDDGSRRGRLREDGHRLGGAGVLLGSAGQSPSSPLSSYSSPSSSLPSPSISPGRSHPESSALDCKSTTNPNIGQSDPGKDGLYIQGYRVASQGQRPHPTPGEKNTLSPRLTGDTSSSLENKVDNAKCGSLLGNQTPKPSLGKQSVDSEPAAPPAADLTGGKAAATAGHTGQAPASAHRADVNVGVKSAMEEERLSFADKKGIGADFSPNRDSVDSRVTIHDLGLSRANDGKCATGTKPSQGSELPQRTTVRRAMSDCSHLSVPMVMAGTYPTTVGGLPLMTPNAPPDFNVMGPACPPRAPYPHVAVRRSFTLMDSAEAAAAVATMMSSQLMTLPVLPSSPPPKRHNGSCETNFLLAVPAPAGQSVNSNRDKQLGATVKSDNKDKQEKTDIMSGKTEKMDAFDKKDKDEQQQKKDNAADKNQKSDEILKDEEKTEKMNVEKNAANEKPEKVDKPEKTNKDDEKKPAEKKKEEEKGGKGAAKPLTGNGSKTLPSPDGKSKPDMGPAKPKATKPRPSTLSTNGEATSTKRPSPTPTSANKKSPVPKQTTPNAAKRPPMASAKTPENGTAEKRPPGPKATPTPRAPANKNGSSSASKAAANKNDKAESKTPGDAKKPKTPARPRPASSTTPATPTPSTNGDSSAHRRRVLTKPPVPKQVPLEKKPPVPRANRTPRPINAPTPDLKNVRSKIGSIDNIKYQPGGGKVSSTQNNKTSDPSSAAATAAKAKVQIVHKKLDFSHITSRCGSKDNIKHVPGGGNVQIQSKKVDVSKVTSKCGSKDNIKYRPGGGDVKIETHKLNIKAKSKIGSMDNVGPGNEQTNGHKEEKAEKKTSSPPSGAPATAPADVAKATAPGGVAKENGAKEATPTPFGGDGLRETLSIDKRITETN